MLQVNQPTEEQTQQENTRQGEVHKSVKDAMLGDKVTQSILNDLGLSPEAEEPKTPKKVVKEEPVEEKPVEEEKPEEEQEEEEQPKEEEEDEEVIPKSKVQKRFDELTAKNKYLEQQIEELKNAKAPEPKDAVTRQLEEMTPEQLKAAKLEVRKAQIKAQDDDAKLNELLSLEDKIDSAISNAPKNFEKAQIDAFNKAVNKIAASGDIPNLDKASPEIMKIAKELYQEYPSLQKDVNGQATALELAVKHYKALNSAPGDKAKETDLKRQVNNLKRKTTLDTKTAKSDVDKAGLDKLRKNAIGGSMQQKINLVKSHPMFNVEGMIPEEFKGS